MGVAESYIKAYAELRDKGTLSSNNKLNRIGRKRDGTPDDNDRVEIGPTPLAFGEWQEAGIECPNLPLMRKLRLEQLTKAINDRGYGGLLLFDPLNIRYATDTTNLMIWNMHFLFRACYIGCDGYMIVWDYEHSAALMTHYNPLIREARGDASMFFYACGYTLDEKAEAFAAEIKDVHRQHAGNRAPLAIDQMHYAGIRAFEKEQIEIVLGQELMEVTRAKKNPEEIKAMRCAMHACGMAVSEMRKMAVGGKTENDVWSVLHAESIRRGSEWIETRLMASGPRTNPWLQECGPRVMADGELLAFDTDLVGCYGMCIDISRTWTVGNTPPTPEQKELYKVAYEQLMASMAELKPGRTIEDVVFACPDLPDEFKAERYAIRMHGIGLCDEWPAVHYQQDFDPRAYAGVVLEPGMAFCVESYIGRQGGSQGVKLEQQVLITEDGIEDLTTIPFDKQFLT